MNRPNPRFTPIHGKSLGDLRPDSRKSPSNPENESPERAIHASSRQDSAGDSVRRALFLGISLWITIHIAYDLTATRQ